VGFEIILAFIWMVQLIAGVVLGVFDVLRQQWLRAVGAIVGLGVGFLANVLIQGPAISKPSQLIALVSVTALVVIFAVRMHWKLLIAVTLIFVIPLAYYLMAISSYPRSGGAAVTFIAVVAEMELLLGPILCSIATRELLGWCGDFTQLVRKSPACILGSMFFLTCVSAYANEGEERWRMFATDDKEATFVIADTDFGTDAIGSPRFSCGFGSGKIDVRGVAREAHRNAIADLVRSDQYPRIELSPTGPDNVAFLELSYSDMSGWEYGFDLSAAGPPFDQFKRTGMLDFKIGEAWLHEEFKVGLDAVAKFQALCKRPSK
jgi:hypothetical protein